MTINHCNIELKLYKSCLMLIFEIPFERDCQTLI